MSHISGPSTPQMRLTVFLLGAALLGFGWFAGHNEIMASAFANDGGVVEANCGSAFSPQRSSNFFPALAQACTSALAPVRYPAIACMAVGSIFLIRLLYMLIGPKTATNDARPHTEGHA